MDSGSLARERVVAVLQARMGSGRFPGKMMAPLGGQPMIEWLLERLVRARRVDEVVLATSHLAQNDVLEDAASRRGIRTLRGDEDDVLSRFVTAAREFSADWVVRVCGDNPFVDPVEIDRLVDFFAETRPDYAFNNISRGCDDFEGTWGNYPSGFGAEILGRDVLEDVGQQASEATHREHVTTYIWDHPERYRILAVPVPAEIAFADLRFDVDMVAHLEWLQPLAFEVGMAGSALDFVTAELRRRR